MCKYLELVAVLCFLSICPQYLTILRSIVTIFLSFAARFECSMMSSSTLQNDTSSGSSNNIQIVARIKPTPDDPTRAITAGTTTTLTVGEDGKSLHFTASTSSAALSSPLARSPARYKNFSFDYVASSDTTQASFFSESGVQALAEGVCQGTNGTVICFGQQGMGKTYTVFGSESSIPAPIATTPTTTAGPSSSTSSTSSSSYNRYTTTKSPSLPPLDPHAGLLPRAVRRVFESIRAEREATPGQLLSFEAKVSFYQIHNEKVRRRHRVCGGKGWYKYIPTKQECIDNNP